MQNKKWDTVFSAIQMIILSEVRKRNTNTIKYHTTNTTKWNVKYGTSEPTYKTETDSQTWRTHLLPRGRGDGGKDWEIGIYRCKLVYRGWINKALLYSTRQYIWYPVITAIFKLDNQQGPTVQHRELCSMLCGSLDGRGVRGRMGTCIYMAESLYGPPETITTLSTGYIQIQNKVLKRFICSLHMIITKKYPAINHNGKRIWKRII